MINFKVECIEYYSNDDGGEGRYLIFIWCGWFSNLSKLSKDLAKIEKKFDKL